jgi:multimeric flavodoxin WrbA
MQRKRARRRRQLVRKGQAPEPLSRERFARRFGDAFVDPRFGAERAAIGRLEAIAWQNYRDGRKAPVTRKAGDRFADPGYELSVEWYETHLQLRAAARTQRARNTRSRVLVVIGSPRNDGTCPGEASKSFELAKLMGGVLKRRRIEVDLLDLSLLTAEYGRRIYPCKGCVSTAMPLCHWPCSCYPNHALGQTGDWMAEIYSRWTAAHGVIVVTPVHWYQSPSALKLMIDRLVCADGGNPDPTSTHGKDPRKAKALELRGWAYPKHLAGRVYGVMVHGDYGGIDASRRALCDWLDGMGLIDAGVQARLGRAIGYLEPYADGHRALARDRAIRKEAGNLAEAVANAVGLVRAGRLPQPDSALDEPRPK